MPIERIISGGQTGVDRASLDAAIKLMVPCGGWCPEGRLAENGKIPDHYYQLQETTGFSGYDERTKRNIRDSDGTLIFVPRFPLDVNDGTVLTIENAKSVGKPHFIVNLSEGVNIVELNKWVRENDIYVLNVAGPRESSCPGIYNAVYGIMKNLSKYWYKQGLLVCATMKEEKEGVDMSVFRQYNF
jgi:hypothetical protein